MIGRGWKCEKVGQGNYGYSMEKGQVMVGRNKIELTAPSLDALAKQRG